jgi:hypothetical protein
VLTRAGSRVVIGNSRPLLAGRDTKMLAVKLTLGSRIHFRNESILVWLFSGQPLKKFASPRESGSRVNPLSIF